MIHGDHFKNTYALLNLGTRRFSLLNKIHIFQCMGKIFCVKFHTKYLTHTLKDDVFMEHLNFKFLDLRARTYFFSPPGPNLLEFELRLNEHHTCDVHPIKHGHQRRHLWSTQATQGTSKDLTFPLNYVTLCFLLMAFPINNFSQCNFNLMEIQNITKCNTVITTKLFTWQDDYTKL